MKCARKLKALFNGCMRGRTMYVLAFSMGPVGSPMSQIGVQLTDSPYVVVNMRIMARIGMPVFAEIDKDHEARGAVHAFAWARRSSPARRMCHGLATTKSTSCIFLRRARSGRYGSGYGGNALLGKKCFALRIASNIARDEGWMAEHMLIVGVENPEGRKDLRGGGVSERLRQNKFRHDGAAQGASSGWKIWTVGDDIAWIKPDANGQLRAINPEAGFFGVAPGTCVKTNPNAMATLSAELDFHQRRAYARMAESGGRE